MNPGPCSPVEAGVAAKNYGLVTSIDELESFCVRLLDGDGPIAFDIETGYHGPDREKFSLHPETAIVAGISFTNSVHWARYAPLNHDFADNLDNLAAARLLWPVLASGRGVAHNAPFELRHLSKWFRELLSDDPIFGGQVRTANGYFKIKSDSQVECYIAAELQHFGLKSATRMLFDRNGRPVPTADLDRRARQLADNASEKDPDKRKALDDAFDGHQMTELHELFPDLPKNKRKMLRFNVLELTPQAVEYACEDSAWCLAIHQRYYPQVRDNPLFQVELAIVQDSVPEMEDFGLAYDWPAMRRTAEQLRAFRDRFNGAIMRELSTMVGQPVAVNLASPKQLATMLFETLGYRTSVYTDKTRDLPPSQRRMSTGKIALAGLAKKHPVVRRIVEWKEQTRLLGTYLDQYEKKFNYADDGRAHPNFMSAVVVTGRFAASDPPVQGSPKLYHYDLDEARDAHTRHAEEHGDRCGCDDPAYAPPPGTCFKIQFRDFITAPEGYYFLGFDLSQAELRAIAGEAQEPELLRAFEEGRDVHTLTASLMLGIPLEQITKAQRDIGKTLNFALLYGMKAKSLGDRLGISTEEAEHLFAAYFNVYSRIKAWCDKQVELGKRQGYVTSRFGRRLPIWEYRSDKRWIRQKGDRACVNYPIQGSATGDYMKFAMIRARTALHQAGLADKVHLVLNVHDALEWYVRRDINPVDVIRVLQPAVIYPIPGWPAMQADWHFGKRWGSPVEVTLTDDGRFLVKTDAEYELKPSVDVDEDTGEEVEVLPEVDPEVLKEAIALTRPDLDPRDGRRLILELDTMPTAENYRTFLTLVDSLPGPHQLTIRTPEGELDVPLPAGGTRLGHEHLSQVYLTLGPSRLRYDASDVDGAALLDGLSL